MYQQYPGGDPQQMPSRPPVPSPVRNAVALMYVGAGLSLVSIIVSLFTTASLRSIVLRANPRLTPAQAHAAEIFGVATAIIIGLIGVGLWIWMAWANRAGKNWARILSTIFFGLDTLSVIVALLRPHALVSLLIGILIWLVGLGAIILLWQRESSDFFQAAS